MSNLSDLLKTLVEAENVTSGGLGPCLQGSEVQKNGNLTFCCRGEGEVSQERVWWIDNMKYWVEGVAVLILCLAGILGEIIGGPIS